MSGVSFLAEHVTRGNTQLHLSDVQQVTVSHVMLCPLLARGLVRTMV